MKYILPTDTKPKPEKEIELILCRRSLGENPELRVREKGGDIWFTLLRFGVDGKVFVNSFNHGEKFGLKFISNDATRA